MKTLRASEVFVPGGLPEYTYVARKDRGLEEHLEKSRDNFFKIATVTGATKAGKTVLVKKVFGGVPRIWLDGGDISSADDFWSLVADNIGAPSGREDATSKEASSELGAEFSAEANILVAKGTGKVIPKKGEKSIATTKTQLATATPAQAKRRILETRTSIIIDDFHYIPRDVQGAITRALKPLVFDGIPVVYLAIPHRRYDAIKVELEMNGRVEIISVPPWDETELALIPNLGFPLLNLNASAELASKLAKEAHGSPHLMQEFCKKLCIAAGVRETVDVLTDLRQGIDLEGLFREVARDLGKNIFDKLARGPRQRTDRLQRTLRSGGTADIYKVVLIALAQLKPGVETVEYEPLRTALKEILRDELPQAHEVSRVLEQMALISSTHSSSSPVIDYEKDERKLHVTDPFFAFFLRWGKELITD